MATRTLSSDDAARAKFLTCHDVTVSIICIVSQIEQKIWRGCIDGWSLRAVRFLSLSHARDKAAAIRERLRAGKRNDKRYLANEDAVEKPDAAEALS